jgi:hypothetical protein
MKTVEFRQDINGGYRTYHCSELAPDGTYVLYAESKEQDDWNVRKRKELELEQIKDNERIKGLEDALRALYEHSRISRFKADAYLWEQARAALEVKP